MLVEHRQAVLPQQIRNRDFLTHHRILFRCRSGTGRSAGTQFVRLFHQMPHTLAVDQLEQQFGGLLYRYRPRHGPWRSDSDGLRC